MSDLSPVQPGLGGSEGGPGAAAALQHRDHRHDQEPGRDLDHGEEEQQPAWSVSVSSSRYSLNCFSVCCQMDVFHPELHARVYEKVVNIQLKFV